MEQNRGNVLAALKTTITNLGSTYAKTVVRSYSGADIQMYLDTDLPLVDMREPNENNDKELTSFRSINKMALVLRIYFVSWAESASSTYEDIIKSVRNAIGANFKATETALKAEVTTISGIQGEMPLYWVDIGLDIRYYLDQKDV